MEGRVLMYELPIHLESSELTSAFSPFQLRSGLETLCNAREDVHIHKVLVQTFNPEEKVNRQLALATLKAYLRGLYKDSFLAPFMNKIRPDKFSVINESFIEPLDEKCFEFRRSDELLLLKEGIRSSRPEVPVSHELYESMGWFRKAVLAVLVDRKEFEPMQLTKELVDFYRQRYPDISSGTEDYYDFVLMHNRDLR